MDTYKYIWVCVLCIVYMYMGTNTYTHGYHSYNKWPQDCFGSLQILLLYYGAIQTENLFYWTAIGRSSENVDECFAIFYLFYKRYILFSVFPSLFLFGAMSVCFVFFIWKFLAINKIIWNISSNGQKVSKCATINLDYPHEYKCQINGNMMVFKTIKDVARTMVVCFYLSVIPCWDLMTLTYQNWQ